VKAITNIRKKHLSVKDLPYILDKARGRPEEDVVNYIVLRSLKQARYSIQNVGHFGLASECYTHFTSPIRRYSDLVVHRILREVLGRKKMKEERMKELEEALPSTAFHCSRRERIADDAERAVVAAMRAWFMKGKVGEELVARIVGVTPQGIKVRLKDFYVDGFLHVSYLTDDYYIYNERNLQLVGRRKKRRFSIGDEITVRVDKVDLDQREIIFGLPRT
ncbi:3'-to-5' exoribonuclease RNase R, partial [hydrothermal vent metagenome]